MINKKNKKLFYKFYLASFFVAIFLITSLFVFYTSYKNEQLDISKVVHQNEIQIGKQIFAMPYLKGFSSAEQRGMKDYIKSISVSKHYWPTIYTYYNSNERFNCVSVHSLSKFSWIGMNETEAEKSLKEIFPRAKLKSMKYRGATIYYAQRKTSQWYGLFLRDGLILIRNSKGYLNGNDLFDLTLKFLEKNV
ncbi:MAG: Uncharacterised protein [Owenweeksia sp. TMED14]|nr:MAG: Uncharacterised protein [Owenweeksia sp. TMED14]